MKKTIASWLSVLLAVLVVSGCNSTQNSSTENTTQEDSGSTDEISEVTVDINTSVAINDTNASETTNDISDIPSLFVSTSHIKKIKDKKEEIENAAKQPKPPKVKNYKEKEAFLQIRKGHEVEGEKNIRADKAFQVLKKFKFQTKIREKIILLVKAKYLDTEKLVKKLKGLYYIEEVSPNYLREPYSIPNDPNFTSLWGMNNTAQTSGIDDADIDAPEAWDSETNASQTVVAVIDSGVDYLHADLANNMWINTAERDGIAGIDDDENNVTDDMNGYDFYEDNNDSMDVFAHGTHVAGIIGAEGDNGIGVTGVSWNVKIMALKVGMTPEGKFSGDAILAAMKYVHIMKRDKGVNIVAVNASYGGSGYDPIMHGVINDLRDEGIIFCAAAGNGGDDYVGDDNDADPQYPASYDSENIIAVANTNSSDIYASSSNYGESSVDLSAPGSGILSTIPGLGFVPEQANVFFDNFENGLANWVSGGTGTSWAISDDQEEHFKNSDFPVPSPTHFLSDSPSDWSDFNADKWIMINYDIDLTNHTEQSLYLSFGHAWWIPDGCHGYVEVSGDSGNNWTQLTDFTDPSYLYYWQNQTLFLIPEAVKTEHFRLRFHLTTGNSVGKGWLIDNVAIGSDLNSPYGYKGGTSMAAPHVAGAVALLSAKFPDENITVRKDRILAGVDPLPAPDRATLTNGRLNLFNAIQNPALVSITPQYGMIGATPFTLNGYSFGDSRGGVEFLDEANNSVEATITSWADTSITATIPSDYPGKKIRIARSTNSKSGYINGSRWSQETALNTGFDSAATIASGNLVYVFGGQNNFSVNNDVRIFDPSNGEWTSGSSDGFTPRAYSAIAEYNGKIYVMGGYSQTENALLDIIEVYDPADGGSWSTLSQTLPMPVALARAVTLNDKIYICGGTTTMGNAENTLYEIDPITGNSTSKANMTANRNGHGMIAYNNNIYVFGGADWVQGTGAVYTQSQILEVYDQTNNTWSTDDESMPIALARFGYALGIVNSHPFIKVSGGTQDRFWWNDEVQTVMTYDITATANKWSQTNEGLDELNSAKLGSSMVFVNNFFYNFGGFDTDGTVTDVEKMQGVEP